MGHSKKSKDKDRDKGEHKRKRRHRSRSHSRERKHKKYDDEIGDYAGRVEYERHNSHPDRGYVHYEQQPAPHREDQSQEFVPKSSGSGNDISLSIAETNRIRAKLGLKPLEEPALKNDNADEGQEEKPGAQEGVHKPPINLGQLKATQSIQEKLLQIKEKRRLNQKLGKVKTLGGSDSEEEGALSWIKKSRKLEKEKELAKKRAKALEEMDEEFGISNLLDQEFEASRQKTYDSKDLRGLRVEHDQERFKEGMTTILTLKDKGILDEDMDDVLVNYNIIDDERAEKNIINKKKLPDYNPYDEPTIDEYGMLQDRNMLSKYDEEIMGKKIDSFELGSLGRYNAQHERMMMEYRSSLLQQSHTLDLPAPELAREFYTLPEMESFNKVKKKVRKIRKKPKVVKADDILPLGNEDYEGNLGRREGWEGVMEAPEPEEQQAIPGLDLVEPSPMDEVEILGPEVDLTGVPVEDEHGREQARVLKKARRLKERKELRGPEAMIVAQLPLEEESDDTLHPTGWASSVTLNATSEFCRALGDIPTYGQAGNRPEEEEDELNDFERELAEQRRLQEEAEEMAATGWQSVEIEEASADIQDEEHVVLDDELVMDGGLASTLQLASSKGYLEFEQSKKGASASRRSDLESQNYSIEDKSYNDLDDKYRRSNRFSGGITQDFKELNYKPEVHLEYVDDSGRQLNPKEAFRQLSHRFHGKGSGKKKTEKRNKKHDQEQLLKGASSTDTPLGTVELLRLKQKSEKSAYLILSGANKATLTGGSVSKTS